VAARDVLIAGGDTRNRFFILGLGTDATLQYRLTQSQSSHSVMEQILNRDSDAPTQKWRAFEVAKLHSFVVKISNEPIGRYYLAGECVAYLVVQGQREKTYPTTSQLWNT